MTLTLSSIPEALRAAPAWVVWQAERRNGKLTKVPYTPSGGKASVTDPGTWVTFEEALAAAPRYSGLGRVLTSDDDLVGVDLDDCIQEDGSVSLEAWGIVERLDSYTEITPSGQGLRVFVRGRLPPGRRKRGWIELYDRARYLTVTGDHLKGTPPTVEARQSQLDALHGEVFPQRIKAAASPASGGFTGDDHELIDRASRAKNGDAFRRLWEGETSGYPSASEADLALCNLLGFWTGGDAQRIDRLFRQSGLYRPKWDERRGELTYGQATIQTAIGGLRETYSPTSGGPSGDGSFPALPTVREHPPDAALHTRPAILIRPALTAMTNEALAALQARPDLGVFVRARMLVTVARDGSPQERWLDRPPGAPVIVPVSQPRMLGLLDEAAEWQKWDRRKNAAMPAMPPDRIAAQVLGRLEWSLRYLEAVIETPTLRPDGSILATPGWDEATGLLYEPEPIVMWSAVPDRPSAEQVREAVRCLLDPVVDFPFVADSDRAAYVAAVFSLLARHMIDGPVPLFAIRAPTPGTGKTLLSNVIGQVGTGRRPPVMAMSYETEELRKRVTSLAVAGAPVVLLDNLSGSLGSDVLAGALTATSWEDRLLGRSEIVRLPLLTVWLVTGNNLGFKRTLARRVIPIDLDAGVEQPEDREGFQQSDLLAYVRRRRPDLVTAALMILRAFHVAGRPAHGGARMGSFEAWDDLVRAAVVWAGFEDPAAADNPASGRGRIRAQADEDVEGLVGMLAALTKALGETTWTAAEAWRAAAADEQLRAALDVAAPAKKRDTATLRSFRYRLRQAAGRPVSGLVLKRADDSNVREQRWRIWNVREERASVIAI